jgi:hypothetical protein
MSANRTISPNHSVHEYWMRVWRERFERNWRVQFKRSDSGRGRPAKVYYPRQATAPLLIESGFEP